jgi:peroxiredoxin Q/BCP
MANDTKHRPKQTSQPQPTQGLLGKPAPPFELPDRSGAPVSLKSLLRSGNLVLYFYPRDMTPGCSKEACEFRDRYEAIRARSAVVAGVSTDSAASHQKFAAKYELDFTLLSDPRGKIARRYGVYKMKKLYGREFEGIERTTFLVDRHGVVRRVFPRVKVQGHADEVLKALDELA